MEIGGASKGRHSEEFPPQIVTIFLWIKLMCNTYKLFACRISASTALTDSLNEFPLGCFGHILSPLNLTEQSNR